MKKKLTLSQTWKNCIRMWKQIDVEWRKLEEKPDDVYRWIGEQKENWMESHGFYGYTHNCFFCEYSLDSLGTTRCKKCPPVKYNPKFQCKNDKYCWYEKPHQFYKEISRLDAKRKSKK